jgi:hypothetical protein
VTATFGTTAPEGSVTVPTIVVCCANVEAEKPIRATRRTSRSLRGNFLDTKTIFLAELNGKFIVMPPHPTAIGNAVNVNGAFHWSTVNVKHFF